MKSPYKKRPGLFTIALRNKIDKQENIVLEAQRDTYMDKQKCISEWTPTLVRN